MKVLFAVNNDDISNAILKKYQKNYREILSYKNVYYFNAIVKELQKDRTYDRVVISEDLEPFANNNYDAIDKFLFEKLDNISDEATNEEGNDTDIIFICSDRRNKSDSMLSKLFGIGIYSAIIGQDRSTDEVCRLIHQPRTKKEAKQYYKIEIDNVNYQTESEDSVSEAEVQNILAHYKRLGRNEDKYVDSFNNIVSQYNDAQLKIIIRYLPIGVKAVLEERSPKYQQLASFGGNNAATNTQLNNYNNYRKNKREEVKKAQSIQVEMLDDESNKVNMSKPIVIPSEVNKNQVKKLITNTRPQESFEEVGGSPFDDEINNSTFAELDELIENSHVVDNDSNESNEVEDYESNLDQNQSIEENEIVESAPVKRGRGRPRKIVPASEMQENKPKRGRGRPRKNPPVEDVKEQENTENDDELIDLFNIDDELNEKEETGELKENYTAEDDSIDLFDLDDSEPIVNTPEEYTADSDNDIDLFDLASDDNEEPDKVIANNNIEVNSIENNNIDNNNELDDFNFEDIDKDTNIVNTQYRPVQNSNLADSLTKDKKIVSFVGTTKNGTSFLVNNVAKCLSSMGIKTAILDLTTNRNSYYIYTKNEEQLMKTAQESINKLRSGIADGVKVNKNLTVYTSLPEEENQYTDAENILSTLVKNYSVVLIDCDFDTPMEYFSASQEIYLVQSMDVLTMQPLTAFLRNMQSKGVLKQEKLKIVINKSVNIKSVSIKTLIGGISKYNDPSMSYMKDLFDRESVPYCVIPFEMQNYIKYLDSVITCSISLNGYSKQFMTALKELCNMIYPLINKQTYSPRGDRYSNDFSNNMNDTLKKMKRKYQ